MTPNILIKDPVIAALPLTESLHLGVIEAIASVCLDGAIKTDEHLIGLRGK